MSLHSGTTQDDNIPLNRSNNFGPGTLDDSLLTGSKNVRLFQKVCSINLNLQNNLYVENAFSLAVCPKATFIAVGTINRTHNSKICRLIVYKLSKMHVFNYCAELNFTNTYFSEHAESYFYDIKIDQYLGKYPIIFGVQQDKEHKLVSYVLVDNKSYIEELLEKEMKVDSSLTPLKELKKKFVEGLRTPFFMPLVEPFVYHGDDVFKIVYEQSQQIWYSLDNSGYLNQLKLDFGSG